MVGDLISPTEMRNAAVLLVCMLVTAVTEVVGIAGLLPLVSVVTRPELVQTNRWLRWAYQAGGFSSVHAFIVFLGVGFLGLYVLTYTTPSADGGRYAPVFDQSAHTFQVV